MLLQVSQMDLLHDKTGRIQPGILITEQKGETQAAGAGDTAKSRMIPADKAVTTSGPLRAERCSRRLQAQLAGTCLQFCLVFD